MRLESEIKLDFKDVLLRPKRSTLFSRKQVELVKKYQFKHSKMNYEGIPIMAANMDGVGTFNMAKKLSSLDIFTCLVKHYNNDEVVQAFKENPYLQKNTAQSVGIEVEENIHSDYICLDVANGYTERFSEVVAAYRSKYPNKTIIAGNVVTAEMTEELILNGADIVKVGIGPGSVCTTRVKTGVGYPQLSAIMECADAAHGLGGHIIADGGCTNSGDVAKAFAAGADFVMLGGMLSGHVEGEGTIITKLKQTGYWTYEADKDRYVPETEKEEFVEFYGMSSAKANEKHFGGLKDYRAAEGKVVLVPFKGNVESTIQDILGGLRSACTYVGASQLKYLSKCATFVRVSQQVNEIYGKSS